MTDDAPLESFGKRAELRNQATKKAWNQLRKYSPADLRALREAAEEYRSTAEAFEQYQGTEEDRRTRIKAEQQVRVIRELLRYRLHEGLESGDDPPKWEELDEDEQQEMLSPNAYNVRSDYLDGITEVLEDSPEGEYGNKTAIYRKVEEQWDLGADACRKVMSRWEHEPQDETEWREYLGM